MVQASQLTAKVSAEGVDTTKSQMQSVGASVTQTGNIFRNALGGALSFTAGLAGQAFGFLKSQVSDSIGLAMAHQDVMQQTVKVLKSTGDASGMTSQSLQDLASSLEKTTYFSRDQTEAGDNMLLTFTNIGKDVFPLATKTMLDMAKAMGGDTKNTALELGKALNDPATGLTALTRVGVTFSTQQQQMIKHMVGVGDTAGAQKIMLQELQREFGGSADATTSAAGRMQIFQDRLASLKENIGIALLPVLDKLTEIASTVLFGAFDKLGGAVHYVQNVLATVPLGDFKDAWVSLGSSVRDLFEIFGSFKSKLDPVKGDFDPLAETIQKLAKGGLKVLTDMTWDAYVAVSAISGLFVGGKGPLEDYGKGLQQWESPLKNIASLLGGQFKQMFQFAGQEIKQFAGWFQTQLLPALKDAEPGFNNLAHVLLDQAAPAIIQIRGYIIDLVEHGIKTFGPIVGDLVPKLVRFEGALADISSKALKFLIPQTMQAEKALHDFAEGIQTRVAPIIKNFIDNISSGAQTAYGIWKAVWPYLEPILKGVFDEIKGDVQVFWSIISGLFNIALDLLGGNWKQALKDMRTMVGGVLDGIKQVFGGFWEFVVGIFGPIGNWFHDRWVEAWSGITGVFGNIGHWFSERWNEVVNFTKTAISKLVDVFMTPFRAIGAAFVWLYDHNTYFKMLIDTITGIVSTGVAWLQNAWKVSIDWIVGAWNDTIKFASDIWGKVSGAIHDGFFAAIGFVASVWGSISSFFVNAWNDYIAGPLGTLWTNVSSFFGNAWTNYIAKPIGDLWTSISTTVGGWVDKAVTWGGNLIQGFVNGIVAKASNVAGAVGGIAQKVLEFLGFHSPTKEGPGREADQWAPNFIKMYTEGLRAGIPQIEGAVSQLVKPVSVSLNPSAGSPAYMPQGTRVIPNNQLSQMQGGASGGAGQPIYLQIDGHTFARLFMPHFVGAVRNNVGVRF